MDKTTRRAYSSTNRAGRDYMDRWGILKSEGIHWDDRHGDKWGYLFVRDTTMNTKIRPSRNDHEGKGLALVKALYDGLRDAGFLTCTMPTERNTICTAADLDTVMDMAYKLQDEAPDRYSHAKLLYWEIV